MNIKDSPPSLKQPLMSTGSNVIQSQIERNKHTGINPGITFGNAGQSQQASNNFSEFLFYQQMSNMLLGMTSFLGSFNRTNQNPGGQSFFNPGGSSLFPGSNRGSLLPFPGAPRTQVFPGASPTRTGTVGKTAPTAPGSPVSQAVLDKIDNSEFNSPKALAKWNNILGDMPPAEREAKARELNRGIAAAKMLQKGGEDAKIAQQFINSTPALKTALDTGEGKGKADGRTTSKDIRKFISRSEDSLNKANDRIKDYQKDNPKAGPQSLALVRSSSMLLANAPLLMAADSRKAQGAKGQLKSDAKNLHIEDLKDIVKNNPLLGSSFRQAAQTWSDKGMFTILGHGSLKGKDLARHGYDDVLWIEDIDKWLKNKAPKSTDEFNGLVNRAATYGTVAGVDTKSLNKDIFDNPQNYTAAQKSAVLVKLEQTKMQLIAGKGIRNTKESQKQVQKRIDQLNADRDVKAYLERQKDMRMRKIITSDPTLEKARVQRINDLKSGKPIEQGIEKTKGDKRAEDVALILQRRYEELKLYNKLHGDPNQSPITLQDITKNNPKLQQQIADAYKDISDGKLLKGLLKDISKDINKKTINKRITEQFMKKGGLDSDKPTLEDQMISYGMTKGTLEQLMSPETAKKVTPPSGKSIYKTMRESGVTDQAIQQYLSMDDKPADKAQDKKFSPLKTAETFVTASSALAFARGKDIGKGLGNLAAKLGVGFFNKVKNDIPGSSGMAAERIIEKVAGKVMAKLIAPRILTAVAARVGAWAAGTAGAMALGVALGPAGSLVSMAVGMGMGIYELVNVFKAKEKRRNERRDFDRTVSPVLDQFGIKKP